MKIVRFEDLDCWKESRLLTKIIYDITKRENLSKDYRLRDQFVGASISIMNNIAEGFGSQSNNEFIRFLCISRRSLSELKSCLYVASDQNYISQDEFNKIFVQSEKVTQVIDGFLRYLRQYKRTQRK